jgi:cation:H+ antiporter
MLLLPVLFFVVGLLLLAAGAELLVRGASQLALALGVPPLLVGLTVVAYSTSAPELAVTLSSAAVGQGNLAVGNVIGSNIFNILFVLGLSALVIPLAVNGQLLRLDVPVMLAASVAMFVLGQDGKISRTDGMILFAGMIVYTAYLVYSNHRARNGNTDPARQSLRAAWRKYVRNLALLGIGVGALILGAEWMVDSATTFAHAFGVSELVIGLTIVAVGTSLPEVAASVAASLRRERDIAAGNAIGSNISNILLVTAAAAIVAPDGLPVPASALNFDLPIMVGAAVICLPILFTGRMIARWEGAVLFMFYVMYTIYVYLTATQATILPMFQAALLFFIIPLTVVTLMSTTLRAMWMERQRGDSK